MKRQLWRRLFTLYYYAYGSFHNVSNLGTWTLDYFLSFSQKGDLAFSIIMEMYVFVKKTIMIIQWWFFLGSYDDNIDAVDESAENDDDCDEDDNKERNVEIAQHFERPLIRVKIIKLSWSS